MRLILVLILMLMMILFVDVVNDIVVNSFYFESKSSSTLNLMHSD